VATVIASPAAAPFAATVLAHSPRPARTSRGDESRIILALAGMVQYGAAMPVEPEPVSTTKRWSASTWALVRGSGGSTGVATPQLGGSQIGARIAYRLDARGRFAAVARAAAAVGTRQQEAALGVEWRPTAAPVRLVVERRFGIANIRGGFAAGAVGGVDQIPLAGDFRLDGYAQGGVIARDGAGRAPPRADARSRPRRMGCGATGRGTRRHRPVRRRPRAGRGQVVAAGGGMAPAGGGRRAPCVGAGNRAGDGFLTPARLPLARACG
jgi:hypothetical protein